MNRNVGRPIEISTALPLTRLTLNADGHLLDAFLIELPHVVPVVINYENVVVAVNLYAMRTRHSAVKHCPQLDPLRG